MRIAVIQRPHRLASRSAEQAHTNLCILHIWLFRAQSQPAQGNDHVTNARESEAEIFTAHVTLLTPGPNGHTNGKAQRVRQLQRLAAKPH